MTNEEATIQALKRHIQALQGRIKALNETIENQDKAIKTLEQESVLNKIRAEIIENSIEDYKYHGCGTDELIIETSEVLKIIDKYKAESEDKE